MDKKAKERLIKGVVIVILLFFLLSIVLPAIPWGSFFR